MKRKILIASITALLSTPSMAATVAGVSFTPAGNVVQFTSDQFQQDFNVATSTLSGGGLVTSGATVAGGELTYAFSGYTLNEALSSVNSLIFSGGSVTFNTQTPGDFVLGNQSTVTNGTEWMTLHGETFFSLTTLANGTLQGSLLFGQTDLSTFSGPAASFFDTNSINTSLGTSADFLVTTTVTNYFTVGGTLVTATAFQDLTLAHAKTLAGAVCAAPNQNSAACIVAATGILTNPATQVGGAGGFFAGMGFRDVVARGSTSMTGELDVPEPATLSLLGLGLLGLGSNIRRKQAA